MTAPLIVLSVLTVVVFTALMAVMLAEVVEAYHRRWR